MSQHRNKIGKKTILWGMDHIFGYFIQVIEDDEDGTPQIVIDIDSVSSSRGRVLEEMKKWDVPEKHMELVALDLPI